MFLNSFHFYVFSLSAIPMCYSTSPYYKTYFLFNPYITEYHIPSYIFVIYQTLSLGKNCILSQKLISYLSSIEVEMILSLRYSSHFISYYVLYHILELKNTPCPKQRVSFLLFIFRFFYQIFKHNKIEIRIKETANAVVAFSRAPSIERPLFLPQ